MDKTPNTSGAGHTQPFEPSDSADSVDSVEAAGHFRIYLGAAAGVGKTYAMLNEGHRRKQLGPMS